MRCRRSGRPAHHHTSPPHTAPRQTRTLGRTLVGALTLVSTVAGCGSARDAASSDLQLGTEGALTVAAALPSPGFWDGDDAATVSAGFEWGLARALADRFDLDLVVVDVPFAKIVAGDLGGADLALAQIETTDERSRLVDFSVRYFDSDFAVVVPVGESIRDLATARERSWSAIEGSREAEFLDETVRPRGGVITVTNETEATELVANGTVEAALVDLPTALILAGRTPGLTVTSRFRSDGHYAAALPSGSPNRQLIDAALRAFASDGTLADLERTWLLPFYDRPPDVVPVIVSR